ncbi:MAG: alpha/beta hydrolase [Patulibacter sp.]|nr:alpha/beta hydrolase [Patulibacter sp.]
MPRARSSSVPPPRLDPRGRMERRALAAIGRFGDANRSDRRFRVGRPIRMDGQTLDVATQTMLGVRARMKYPSWHEQSFAEGRATMRREALLAAGPAIPVAAVEELEVDGGDGPLPARLYRPGGPNEPTVTWQAEDERLPLLVFFHGGGFILGDLDSHDAVCRMFCRFGGMLVLSVAYRLAPEHPFPAGVDDAIASFRWAVDNAASLGADADRIAVGGDSAGGNFSAVVAQADARSERPALALQVLLYPAVDFVDRSASRERFGRGFYLEAGSMDWVEANYLPPEATQSEEFDRADPRLSPVRASVDDLRGVAPAIVVTAGFDPLRDEGEAYARRLSEAGVPVLARRIPDLIHGFANTLGVGRRSRETMLEVVGMTRGMLEVAPARRARSGA